MPKFYSFFAAYLPLAIFIYFNIKYNLYCRKNLSIIIWTIFWGGFASFLITLWFGSLVSSSINNTEFKNLLTAKTSLFVAPIIEEFSKSLILFPIIITDKIAKNTEAMLFGAMVGLSFAATENFSYFIAYGATPASWINIVAIRTVFSTLMHTAASCSVALFISYSKNYRSLKKIIAIIPGYTVAILIHYYWNFFVQSKDTLIEGAIIVLLSFVFFLFIFLLLIRDENRIIYEQLSKENDLIPENHLKFLNSTKRLNTGWIDEPIRKDYIRAATELAFMKNYFVNSKRKKIANIENEQFYYRNFITYLLKKIR